MKLKLLVSVQRNPVMTSRQDLVMTLEVMAHGPSHLV